MEPEEASAMTKPKLKLNPPFLWYRNIRHLRIGEVDRYTIQYKQQRDKSSDKEETSSDASDSADDVKLHCEDDTRTFFFFRLKNIEKPPIRAFHLLNGPFILYCHVIPCRYQQQNAFTAVDPETHEIEFANQIQPGQTFNVKLHLNLNSFLKTTDDGCHVYQWEIEIVSQIIQSRRAVVSYDFMLGEDLKYMKRMHSSRASTTFSILSKLDSAWTNVSTKVEDAQLGELSKSNLTVSMKDVDDLWSLEPKDPSKPVHLVIISHGILSNLTADMLFLRDSLVNKVDDNLVVTGCRQNAGRTERGIRKLGISTAEFVMEVIPELQSKGYIVDKISFVGHSFGGPVQLYCMKYILETQGTDYFQRQNIQPTHFVTLASPLLGVVTDLSFIFNWLLDVGTLGRTGKDLTLLKQMPSLKSMKKSNSSSSSPPSSSERARQVTHSLRPVLEELPEEPVKTMLGSFKTLTVYANAINDGIVPLRTAAILYLDYRALGDVTKLRHHKEPLNIRKSSIDGGEDDGEAGEIPLDNEHDDGSSETSTANTSEKFQFLMGLNLTNGFGKGRDGKFEKTVAKTKKKLTKRQRKFLHFSAKGINVDSVPVRSLSDSGEEEEVADDDDDDETETVHDDRIGSESDDSEPETINIPPKANTIESAINSLICPVPSYQYLVEPDTRPPVVFHDKLYSARNIPPTETDPHVLMISRMLNTNRKRLVEQIKIARKYHSDGMVWRKVLVNLPPDAHNNMVVRRRFANGYGWGVIDHLCQEVMNDKARQCKM